MPELPEVESVRQDLLSCVLHQKIKGIEITWPKLVKKLSVEEFIEKVLGQPIKDIQRIGKLLIFEINQDLYWLIHLKMTGQLIFKDKKCVIGGGHTQEARDLDVPHRHTRATITFQDGSALYFNDMRKFGYFSLVNRQELEEIFKNYGLEPGTPNWQWPEFEKLLKKHSSAKLKAFLLNQKYISGLGNIYADEACFCAALKSQRVLKTLTTKDRKALFDCIYKVIIEAVAARGTTFRDYRDGRGQPGNYFQRLKVFQRQGEKCVRCGEIIVKKKFVGRGTHFCPNCQK
jgi:formamidopyrimidine-DNA glycosylase